jgi:hypothetical protein
MVVVSAAASLGAMRGARREVIHCESSQHTVDALPDDEGPRNGALPPPSERILTGVLEKRTITAKGLSWRKRNAVLSPDYLSFGKVIDDWYVEADLTLACQIACALLLNWLLTVLSCGSRSLCQSAGS